MPVAGPDRPVARGRVDALDLARTFALVCMAIYHFTYDLEMFGYIPPYTAVTGGWAIFARMIAGGFLFMVGISLYLAHGRGIRWRPFLRRLGVIVLAAALITAVTRYAMPQTYIFFGILHSIAAASLLGLAFLRLPSWMTLGIAALIVFGRSTLSATGLFDAPVLAGLGLTSWPVRSADFVPVFPWFAATLAGIAFARIAGAGGLWRRLARSGETPGRWRRALAWPGRHGLTVYLLHQPVLISALWVFARLTR
jgi:uncharacterized membrane protein